MSANSATRHLRLAVSAGALLLASGQFNGSIAKAAPAADLDTLIMASLQTSGRSDSASESKTTGSKAGLSKSAAAKKHATKRPGKKTSEPMVVQIAPQQGGGGLLAAIGAVGGGSMPSGESQPSPSRGSAALGDTKFERSAGSSGPAVFMTSGYGQSEPQTQPSLPVAQAPAFAFGTSEPAVSAPKLETTEKLVSNGKPGKAGKAAPKQIAAVAPPVAEPSPQPSGLGAFLSSLGFGERAASTPANEAKADSAPLSMSSAGSSSSLKSGEQERSKADIGITSSTGHSPSSSRSIGSSSIASAQSASSSAPLSGSVTSSVTASAAEAKHAMSDRSIANSSRSASLDPHSKAGSHDRSKAAIVSTASIGSTSVSNVSPKSAKSVGDKKAIPSIAAAESAPARPSVQPPASQSGGLFAALGAGGGSDSSQVETTAQIPVAYPEPVVVSRNVPIPGREMTVSPGDPAYRVDAGDKLRVVVYGQEGLTNTYAIDAGGGITMPLIGRVVARGLTPAALAADITGRLRKGFIREPSVAVEIEAYRPFFILGEVAAPGQYPYVPNMSVEAAVAIAGGFSPRARRDSVTLTHRANGGQYREAVPLGTSLSPGDTITVGERWF